MHLPVLLYWWSFLYWKNTKTFPFPFANSLFSPIRMLLLIIDVSLRPHSGDYVQHTNPAISCNLTTNQKYTDRIHKMLIKRVAFQAPVHMRCSVSGPHGFCSVGQRISRAQILEGDKLTRGHISLKCWGRISSGEIHTGQLVAPSSVDTIDTTQGSHAADLFPLHFHQTFDFFLKQRLSDFKWPYSCTFGSKCLSLMSKRCFISENIQFVFTFAFWTDWNSKAMRSPAWWCHFFCVQPKRFRCTNFICDTY